MHNLLLQDKLLLVLQLHDTSNPDPTLWKDGGRRRSIILARGDYCPETRDNIMLLLNKMKLRRALKRLKIPYMIMGDLKMMNTLTGYR